MVQVLPGPSVISIISGPPFRRRLSAATFLRALLQRAMHCSLVAQLTIKKSSLRHSQPRTLFWIMIATWSLLRRTARSLFCRATCRWRWRRISSNFDCRRRNRARPRYPRNTFCSNRVEKSTLSAYLKTNFSKPQRNKMISNNLSRCPVFVDSLLQEGAAILADR